jgi:hypothetical protein
MNNQYLRIGGGPDFLMTVGKMMHSHHAEVDLAFASGAVFRAPATNASLGALIKEIHNKLVAIGWVRADRIKWTAQPGFTGNATGPRGSATIRFKLPKELTNIQELTIQKEIKKLFR